jgi:N-acetylmuramoyl-L-alanine amidase
MALKTILNYSPNFNPKKRTYKKIKFIIFHYTGMKKESETINRLTNIQSEVSSHYLIKNNGIILTLVPDLYEAWHAGKSSWKNYKSLNQNSIGIEITNPGHKFGYKKFSKKQIFSLLKLSKFLMKKYKISTKNILGHSDIAPERKKDPGEKFPWEYLSKNNIGLWHSLKKK